MRTIGLIGGMSWKSTLEYYRIINEEIAAHCGGLHSAEILMRSIDLEPIARMQEEHRWEEIAAYLGTIAAGLETAGADFLIIACNTMHHVADAVAEAVSIPLLHIADTAAAAVAARGIKHIGLLGTAFTLRLPFYVRHLEKAGISVSLPDDEAIDFINHVIYDELCQGSFTRASKDRALEIIAALQDKGAQGIVLGCTELPMLIKPEDISVELFDTLHIHAVAAAAIAATADSPRA